MQATAREIQQAGGFEKWLARQNRQANKTPRKKLPKATFPETPMPEAVRAILKNPLVTENISTNTPNGLESEHWSLLKAAQQESGVVWFGFEALTFELAHRCTYTPDWVVLYVGGRVCCEEDKGPFAWEDSIVKLKVAARLFQDVTFRLWRKDKDGVLVCEEVER